MSSKMFSELQIKGVLVNKVLKESVDEKTGVISSTHFLYFMMNNQKGLENVKVKDPLGQYTTLEIGKPCVIPIRVTASNMGSTFYEVAEQVELNF